VLANLLLNALKFTPAGGSVRVRAAAGEGVVAVSVSDTGAGIAAQDVPRVFERFYKADRARGSGGTGLGLAIVKHTVEAHGGRVTVESHEGQGTTFTFTVPTART
jgi:two-component system phosphate regulon sensor histidine kinase PhoR